MLGCIGVCVLIVGFVCCLYWLARAGYNLLTMLLEFLTREK
jgi:hypothetical protein